MYALIPAPEPTTTMSPTVALILGITLTVWAVVFLATLLRPTEVKRASHDEDNR